MAENPPTYPTLSFQVSLPNLTLTFGHKGCNRKDSAIGEKSSLVGEGTLEVKNKFGEGCEDCGAAMARLQGKLRKIPKYGQQL